MLGNWVMIKFENVTKYYGDNVGLENVSISIDKGDFVFLVGPSGAGKSTFIKLILKEINADAGSILVNGTEVTKLKNHEVPKLRQSIGIVFQDFRLLPRKTVYENVAFAMEIFRCSTSQIRKRVPQVLEIVGIGNKANYKMIAALAVKQGDLDRKELANFIKEKGLVGWAPTQGHIPSGIPYAGHAIKDLTEGDYNRVMFVGKGSLFLGRMTNLFDGVSIVMERNDGKMEDESSVSSESEKDQIKKVIAESMRKLAENLLAE